MGFVGFPIAVVLLVVRLVLSGAVPGPWAAWAMELCAPGVVVASGLVGQQWCTLLRWLVCCVRRACIVVVILSQLTILPQKYFGTWYLLFKCGKTDRCSVAAMGRPFATTRARK